MVKKAKYCAAILAGGLSTRMGFPKLLLAQDGRLCAERMVADLLATGWEQVAVVVSDETLIEFVKMNLLPANIISNPEPARGMISSLRLALDWAEEDAAGLLALPIDHPLVARGTLEILRREADPECVVVPQYQGQRGHPTWWGRASWEALRSSEADEGANKVLRLRSVQVRELPVDDFGVTTNINTLADAERNRIHIHSE